MGAFKLTLANEYAYATENALATLSSLLLRKNTPKCDISRHRSICLRQLGICQSFKSDIEWGDTWRHHFGRVEEIIAETNLETGLDKWIAEHKR